MKHKIKTKYRRASDSYTINLGYRVAHSMKDNPDFPEPKPAPAALKTACDELQEAMNLAGRKDRHLSSAKNDKKGVLIRLLDETADYVTVISNGDKTKLLSSGFDITGITDESQELKPIESLTVESGPPGQATTRVKLVAGARAYIHQYTPDPITADSVWVSETVTDREHTFSNLQSV